MKWTQIAHVLLLATPLVANATTVAAGGKTPQGISGKGQLGFVASQGNAQGKSANAALDLTYVAGPWKHALSLAGLYGQSTGVVSAERWSALWQSDRKISSRAFAFGSLRYEHDMFDGFQYQATAASGLGYRLIQSKSTTLSTQLGAGYTLSRPETLTRNAVGAVTARTPLASQGYAIGTLGINYQQTLTSTTTLSDILLVNSGSANTLATNNLALAVKVSTRLAMSIGYQLQNNTHPPAGIRHLDSTETVNLVYAF
jgi:putative salt-induced outer membrane protein